MSSRRKDSKAIRKRAKAPKTYKAYIGFANRFIKWLLEENTNAEWRSYVKTDMARDTDEGRAVFNCFKLPLPDDLVDAYYDKISLNPSTGIMRSVQTPDGFHATLGHIYKVQKIKVPESTEQNWTEYRAGFKNSVQDEIEEKGLFYYEGKDILPNKGFEQAQILSLDPRYTTKGKRSYIPCLNAWSRCLGARVDTARRLLLTTMRWNDDGIAITVPQHKADQGGQRVVSRQVHPNPEDPLHCPLFWLFVRMCSCPEFGLSPYLFGSEVPDVEESCDADDESDIEEAENEQETAGSKSAQSFQKPKRADGLTAWLKATIGKFPENEQVKRFGCLAKNVGSHSNRKHAMESLTTMAGGPPHNSVMLRLCKTLPKNEATYVHNGNSGDKMASRISVNLSLNEPTKFAALCPRFDPQKVDVSSIKFSAFCYNYDSYPPYLQEIVPYLAAVFMNAVQSKFVDTHFHKSDVLFSCPLYTEGYVAQLSKEGYVLLGHLSCPITGMEATGVPVEVRLGCQLRVLEGKIEVLTEAVQQSKDAQEIAEALRPVMEDVVERSIARFREDIGALRVSRDAAAVESMQDPGLSSAACIGRSTEDSPAALNVDTNLSAQEVADIAEEIGKMKSKGEGYTWSLPGSNQPSWHPIPAPFDYSLSAPKTMATLFHCWHNRNEVTGAPALKMLTHNDILPGKSLQYYYRAKNVIDRLHDVAQRKGLVPAGKRRISEIAMSDRIKLLSAGMKTLMEETAAHNGVNKAKKPRSLLEMSPITFYDHCRIEKKSK